MSAFFALHAELPREGPGDRASLDTALGKAVIPPDARILDAACGPGADIEGLLAHAPNGHVTAIDAQPHFTEQARARWDDDPRVTLETGDMRGPEGPFDLIWCAGALYFLGITEGLRHFSNRLAPGGAIAFSELVFLTETPQAALMTALRAEYPPIGGIATLKARIAAAGCGLIGLETLSDAAWEAYYTPLEARIAALRPDAGPDLAAVLEVNQAEIALWRAHRCDFGYALAVVRPR